MAKTERKFFDDDWNEVPPERATQAVELETDKNGIVTRSTTFKVKAKEPKRV